MQYLFCVFLNRPHLKICTLQKPQPKDTIIQFIVSTKIRIAVIAIKKHPIAPKIKQYSLHPPHHFITRHYSQVPSEYLPCLHWLHVATQTVGHVDFVWVLRGLPNGLQNSSPDLPFFLSFWWTSFCHSLFPTTPSATPRHYSQKPYWHLRQLSKPPHQPLTSSKPAHHPPHHPPNHPPQP
jgi:hypothetical protein